MPGSNNEYPRVVTVTETVTLRRYKRGSTVIDEDGPTTTTTIEMLSTTTTSEDEVTTTTSEAQITTTTSESGIITTTSESTIESTTLIISTTTPAKDPAKCTGKPVECLYSSVQCEKKEVKETFCKCMAPPETVTKTVTVKKPAGDKTTTKPATTKPEKVRSKELEAVIEIDFSPDYQAGVYDLSRDDRKQLGLQHAIFS